MVKQAFDFQSIKTQGKGLGYILNFLSNIAKVSSFKNRMHCYKPSDYYTYDLNFARNSPIQTVEELFFQPFHLRNNHPTHSIFAFCLISTHYVLDFVPVLKDETLSCKKFFAPMLNLMQIGMAKGFLQSMALLYSALYPKILKNIASPVFAHHELNILLLSYCHERVLWLR